MDGKMLRHIRALRAMGATYVRIGGTEVRFAPPVAEEKAESADAINQVLNDALNQFHDAVDDQREVTSLEDKAERARQIEKLKYAHS